GKDAARRSGRAATCRCHSASRCGTLYRPDHLECRDGGDRHSTILGGSPSRADLRSPPRVANSTILRVIAAISTAKRSCLRLCSFGQKLGQPVPLSNLVLEENSANRGTGAAKNGQ